MKKTDEDLLVSALEAAQCILAEHLLPDSPYSAAGTINRLFQTLDSPELAEAQDRLKAKRRLHIVK